ncbi:MAG: chemotaxis protein CheW [Leptospirales bacterium]|nr:chemotaxis protein CheW [Leptospirales bacterium]
MSLIANEAKPAQQVDELREANVLRERAALLARPRQSSSSSESNQVLLQFSSCGQRFAVDALAAAGVAYVNRAIRLPNTPARLRGLVRVGGETLYVIDLAAFLGRTASAAPLPSRFLALRLALSNRSACIEIESDVNVATVSSVDMVRVTAESALQHSSAVSGMLSDGRIILDAAELLQLAAAQEKN